MRAFPTSKALPAGFGATPHLRRLALSDTSIRRKRHESVMSSVMAVALNAEQERSQNAVLATWVIRSENRLLNDFVGRYMMIILIQMASIERLSFCSVYLSIVDKMSLSPQLYSW